MKKIFDNAHGYMFLIGAVYLAITIIMLPNMMLNEAFYKSGGVIKPELASQYGSFIGGMFGPLVAIASTLFLVSTLLYQIKSSNKNQVENVIYKLIDYHRENVDKILIENRNGGSIRGYLALQMMTEKFDKIYDCVKINGVGLSEDDILDISYKMFYYGYSTTSDQVLKKVLSQHFDNTQYGAFIAKMRKNPPSTIYLAKDYSVTIALDHQLGHYFRNLHNAVKTIDIDSTLSKKERKFYMKMLRTQLSTPEIWLLFLNSRSSLGTSWTANTFIDRYELIKNLPYKYSSKIDHEKYYPNIEYEYNETNIV